MSAARQITPGHLLGAGCFLLLAGFRAAEGSWLWAAIFALAAASQVYLGWRAAPARPAEGARQRRASGEVQRNVRIWRAMTASSCLLTVALLVVQPALSVIAAAIGLCCSWMVVRTRAEA
ncbi:hypothetical protein ABT337_03365 [Saccharopolyspora hirsuta]|uniref:Uncharacterized protein n=1 Tax=Saccharopolyspora hordei TaxID=1838 RepID=A0A853ARR0_9PSEU|nr:hypothetical protein [Saccharopolyspora hordei]NYI84201.1 hypothetical protein [Saccharopolyspora hordei]